jgi:hypothetical protein
MGGSGGGKSRLGARARARASAKASGVTWSRVAGSSKSLGRRCAGRLHDDLLQALDACNGRGLRGALSSVCGCGRVD